MIWSMIHRRFMSSVFPHPSGENLGVISAHDCFVHRLHEFLILGRGEPEIESEIEDATRHGDDAEDKERPFVESRVPGSFGLSLSLLGYKGRNEGDGHVGVDEWKKGMEE